MSDNQEDEQKREERKMKIGNLPAGDRKLTQGRLGTLGGLSVTTVDRFRTNVILNDREIKIPTDIVISREGIMGNVYGVTVAEYVDDKKVVSKEVAQELQERIASAYTDEGDYVKFE